MSCKKDDFLITLCHQKRRPSVGHTALELPKVLRTTFTAVERSWSVSFEPDFGDAPSITMNTLASWMGSTDAGVKYI